MASEVESQPFLQGYEDISWRKGAVQHPHPPLRHAPNNQTHRLSKLPSGVSHLIVFLAASLFWGCIFLSIRKDQHSDRGLQIPATGYQELQLSNPETYGSFSKNARFLGCGFSIEDAKSLGCEYDILSGKWLPSFCVDQDAIADYQSDGSWFGYGDENRTELLTIDQMGEREVYYTSVRDHIVHCASLWRKQFQAFFEGRTVIDSVIASKEHTHHCSQFLIDMTDFGTEFRTVPIKVFVKSSGCFVKN